LVSFNMSLPFFYGIFVRHSIYVDFPHASIYFRFFLYLFVSFWLFVSLAFLFHVLVYLSVSFVSIDR
jgi:hypothetical protein